MCGAWSITISCVEARGSLLRQIPIRAHLLRFRSQEVRCFMSPEKEKRVYSINPQEALLLPLEGHQ